MARGVSEQLAHRAAHRARLMSDIHWIALLIAGETVLAPTGLWEAWAAPAGPVAWLIVAATALAMMAWATVWALLYSRVMVRIAPAAPGDPS